MAVERVCKISNGTRRRRLRIAAAAGLLLAMSAGASGLALATERAVAQSYAHAPTTGGGTEDATRRSALPKQNHTAYPLNYADASPFPKRNLVGFKMPSASRAASFLNSLGVNVHVEYTDGKYANSSQVVSDLAYLGVDHVRDATLNAGNQGQSSYGVLAAAGIKFDLIFLGWNIPSSFSLLDKFLTAHPGAVDAIEGPNEINNWPMTYDGLTGVNAALAYQSALYQTAASDPLLGGVPVYNFTDNALHASAATDNNLHPYVHSGAQPYVTLSAALNAQLAAEPGKPVVDTETGYYTLTNGVGWGGVDAPTQAKLTLNLLLDSFQLGYARTYIYQLLDAYSDPNGTNSDDHFGLFDINNNPKPVAAALHNVTTLLQDTGATAGSFQTGALDYQLSGLPSTGHDIVLEKSNGAFDLVIWNEPSIWNNTTHAAIDAAPVQVTIQLGTAYNSIEVYDPLVGLKPLQSANGAQQIQVTITDHPLIVELSGPQKAQSASATLAEPGQVLSATAAAPQIAGGAGSDTLSGWSGDSTLSGGAGNDSVIGGAGFNIINGNTGDDTIQAGSGPADWLSGGQGNDVIHGGSGADIINGNLGSDTIYGGSGPSTLRGGAGDDVIVVGSGEAWVSGDKGQNTITAGSGSDTFHLGSGDNLDRVVGFDISHGDRVQVDAGFDCAVVQQGSDTVVTLSTGAEMVLVGVQSTSLSPGWIFAA